MNAEQSLAPSPNKPMAFYIASAITGIAAGGLGIGALVSTHEVRTAHTSESEYTITDVEAQEPIFAGLPTPTMLPDLDDKGILPCSIYESRTDDNRLRPNDYLGVLACEQYLRDPRVIVVDFAEQSDGQLQTYVDMLGMRARAVGLLNDPVFRVIPASAAMQRSYQESQTRECDIYARDTESNTSPPPTARDIAKQFVPEESYDRLIALTDRSACRADNGMRPAGTARGGEIDLYDVDLSTDWGMVEAAEVGLHEAGHTQLGHSGELSLGHDPNVKLRMMQGGVYHLWGAMADSNRLSHYAGDGVMGGQRSQPGLNAVQEHQLQWPERALGERDDRLVRLWQTSATFTPESTPEDMAVVKLAKPVELPRDETYAVTKEQKKHLKTESQPSVEELYFVANELCAYLPNSAAATKVRIYARDTYNGDVFLVASLAPMLDEPDTLSDNEYNHNLCQPSAGLIRRDYAADLHLGGDEYVTLRYDGGMNELHISESFTRLQPEDSGPVAQ